MNIPKYINQYRNDLEFKNYALTVICAQYNLKN